MYALILSLYLAAPVPEPKTVRPYVACLPSRAFIDEQWARAQRHRAWVEGQRWIEGHSVDQYLWDYWVDDAEERVRIWCLVYWACYEECGPIYQQERIKDLREAIGDAAFYAGQIPDPVPLWRVWPR